MESLDAIILLPFKIVIGAHVLGFLFVIFYAVRGIIRIISKKKKMQHAAPIKTRASNASIFRTKSDDISKKKKSNSKISVDSSFSDSSEFKTESKVVSAPGKWAGLTKEQLLSMISDSDDFTNDELRELKMAYYQLEQLENSKYEAEMAYDMFYEHVDTPDYIEDIMNDLFDEFMNHSCDIYYDNN